MQWKDGGVVDDGAVLWVVDDVHGDKLGAEGHDVKFSTHRFVGLHYLWNGFPLDPPPRELEHRRPFFLRHHRLKEKRRVYQYSSEGRDDV